MAGKTAHSPSQYRQELQTGIRRSASSRILVPCMLRRFPSCDPSEHTADGHADACRVALAEHSPGHDLPGGEHTGGSLTAPHEHASLLVYACSHLGEGDARP